VIDLTGLRLVKEHIELHSVDSTNRYALDVGREGLLVTAREQTAGRGRQGRVWFSPPGQNIYMTLTVPDPDPLYPLVTGVAVRAALAGIIGDIEELKIKWPNDILIRSRKVCGILCEARGTVAAIGIGVNVNQSAWPDGLTNTATSLKIVAGRTLVIEEVMRALLLRLDHWFALYQSRGFSPIRASFLEHGLCQGSPGRLEDGTPCIVLGISEEGSLVVEVQGRRRTIMSGDVALVSAEHPWEHGDD